MKALRRTLLLAALALALVPTPGASAQEGGGSCLTTDPPPPGEITPIRFGITTRLAGTAGTAQEEPAAEGVAQR